MKKHVGGIKSQKENYCDQFECVIRRNAKLGRNERIFVDFKISLIIRNIK